MPDISMCLNQTCGKRLECYRFMAKPTPYWQAYSDFQGAEDGCTYFLPIYTAPTKLRGSENENNCSGSGNDSPIS